MLHVLKQKTHVFLFLGSDAFLYIAFIFVVAKLIVGILLWSGIERVCMSLLSLVYMLYTYPHVKREKWNSHGYTSPNLY